MPTEFLTDAQEQAYGHFVGPPSNQQLAAYFHLDDADRELVNMRRGDHNKLGFVMWTFRAGRPNRRLDCSELESSCACRSHRFASE